MSKKVGDFLYTYGYMGFSDIPTYSKYKIVKITPKRYQVQAENNPDNRFYVDKETLKGIGVNIRLKTEIPDEWIVKIKTYNRKKQVNDFIKKLSREIDKIDVESELFLKIEAIVKEKDN